MKNSKSMIDYVCNKTAFLVYKSNNFEIGITFF